MNKQQFIEGLLKLESELFSFAVKLTKSDEKARDLLQETFLRVLSNQDKYREEKNFRAWVYTILKNQFINDYRKEKNNKICDHLTSDLDYLNNILSIPADSNLTVKEIITEINKLPSTMGKPFKMFVNGYGYKEIVELTGIKLGTVKSRIHFARKILTKNIKRYETAL